MSTEAHNELVTDLQRLLAVKVLDPLEILLDDGFTALRARVRIEAETWAAQLLDPGEKQATMTAARLIGALFPADGPFSPPDDWWRTPLGRAVALRAGHPGAVAVSYTTAGAMLGITRQGVGDLVKRGKLSLHPDGGVATDSIRTRLNHATRKERHVHIPR